MTDTDGDSKCYGFEYNVANEACTLFTGLEGEFGPDDSGDPNIWCVTPDVPEFTTVKERGRCSDGTNVLTGTTADSKGTLDECRDSCKDDRAAKFNQ